MKTGLQKLKSNLFFLLVIMAYIVLFIFKSDTAISAADNSIYYFKEMLMIMPVIFVLTALLDTWVPKKTILKYLGKDSGAKGVFLSFFFGAISAGPIYAAFPVCVMLHKKGASVRNLILILSSWAVIKIPMLLNEVKFLGFTFMFVRWILTVIAILIFSWIASKIVKDEDIPKEIEEHKAHGLYINAGACMGCKKCTLKHPEYFVMKDGKAAIIDNICDLNMEKIGNAIEECPVSAIEFE